MELNRINYKKVMDKIPIPQDVDDKVIKMFEEETFQITNSLGRQNRKLFKRSTKVLLIAATIVVLSCGSIFAYNKVMTAKLVNPALHLNHSDNVDVNGVEYIYDGGETLAEEVKDENLSIILASVVTDDTLAYIRFNVSTVNGESLITNEELKKSVLSMQQFDNMVIKLDDAVLDKNSYFMFRVDSGDDESKAVLEMTIQKAGNLPGKTISISGTNYVDTYHLYDENGKVIGREKQTLYNGTWNFSCNIPSDNGSYEYNGAWNVTVGNDIGTISHVKVTDLQLFFEGIYNVRGQHESTPLLYLIYEDGTKIEAGNKVESFTGKNGDFTYHYLLKNLIMGKRVVAIEFGSNFINLK